MKFYSVVFSFLFGTAAYALPTHDILTLPLSQIEQGESCPKVLLNAPVEIEYDYDFKRAIGQAYLNKLGSTSWKVDLFPLGLTDYYGFMSDMQPTPLTIEGEKVTVYRIVFLLNKNGQSQVMLMIGEEGDCIMSSSNINL